MGINFECECKSNKVKVYYRKGYRNFDLSDTPKEMRQLRAVLVGMGLPDRFFKSTGGYYFMDTNGILHHCSRTIDGLTYNDYIKFITTKTKVK